jgi:hypothetical protein
VSLLDAGLADDFFGGRGAEIVLDISFERRLIALEGQQVIGVRRPIRRNAATAGPTAAAASPPLGSGG